MEKATIIVELVDAATETPNSQIEEDIRKEAKIPWMKDILSVHITISHR